MSEVMITPPEQEMHVPEANALEKLNGMFYRLGKVTRESRLPHAENATRPLSLRHKRAELYRRTQVDPVAERPAIFAEARARDEIAAQYLNQGEVKVNLPGLGEQVARYTMIEPPEGRKSVENGSKPPIFLIPGISNDIDCVGALTQELPYEGRSVVVVGFPESFMGRTTGEFADAVDKSEDFGPHVEFYKQAIKGLMGDKGDIELWGFSTGAPIAAQLLNDPEMQQRVTDATFLSPASCVDQSVSQINIGSVKEGTSLLKRFSSLAKYSFTNGVSQDLPQQEKAQSDRRKSIMKTLMRKVGETSKWYGSAKVKEGGSIVVVSGDKDEITKSYKANNVFAENPQAKIVELPEGHHSTPLIDPESVVPKIFEAQAR